MVEVWKQNMALHLGQWLTSIDANPYVSLSPQNSVVNYKMLCILWLFSCTYQATPGKLFVLRWDCKLVVQVFVADLLVYVINKLFAYKLFCTWLWTILWYITVWLYNYWCRNIWLVYSVLFCLFHLALIALAACCFLDHLLNLSLYVTQNALRWRYTN